MASIEKQKRNVQKIMTLFAKEYLPGCDFDMGQTQQDIVNNVIRWLKENNSRIEKIIKDNMKK